MTNTAMFKTMIDRYNALAFTHEYVFGFIDRGNVYMVFTDSSVMPYVLCLDRASRGAGLSLRFRPNKSQKEMLKTCECEMLCTAEYFNACVADSKYNKGEIFEKMVTEYMGQEWVKDSVPFTQDGDVTANGIAYQVKFQGATFCNEKSLANLK
jgi:hypothetical protein